MSCFGGRSNENTAKEMRLVLPKRLILISFHSFIPLHSTMQIINPYYGKMTFEHYGLPLLWDEPAVTRSSKVNYTILFFLFCNKVLSPHAGLTVSLIPT